MWITKQILAFLFCFTRELNLYTPRRKKIIILYLLRDCEAKIYERSCNHYWYQDSAPTKENTFYQDSAPTKENTFYLNLALSLSVVSRQCPH